VLLAMIRRQERSGTGASSRDLVRAIEEAISDSLIEAKAKHAKRIILIQEGEGVTAQASN
jgi:ATP-dependent Clp protease ATP-binding subunit ClpE